MQCSYSVVGRHIFVASGGLPHFVAMKRALSLGRQRLEEGKKLRVDGAPHPAVLMMLCLEAEACLEALNATPGTQPFLCTVLVAGVPALLPGNMGSEASLLHFFGFRLCVLECDWMEPVRGSLAMRMWSTLSPASSNLSLRTQLLTGKIYGPSRPEEPLQALLSS